MTSTYMHYMGISRRTDRTPNFFPPCAWGKTVVRMCSRDPLEAYNSTKWWGGWAMWRIARMAWQVFLSYSRQQYYMAELLVLHLQKRGITVWFDMQQIEPGEQWKSEIQHGLENAEIVLLLLSTESLASPYVADEWRYALEHGRPVIVALVEYLSLPPELQNQPIIDCRGNLNDAVDALHHAILHPDAPCAPVSSAPRHPDVIKQMLRAFRLNHFTDVWVSGAEAHSMDNAV
ncbi:toll/interleukin-1 receptor domain-containing protein [bacterium]|nr:toll/interleukin-1 receptor domain-containing protein [bacterium]